MTYLSNSLIFAAVISAALFPENNIEPNVGPILASPCVSVTDIPAATCDAGVKFLNLTKFDDLIMKDGRITGIVVNWIHSFPFY